ncbi:RedB [bacterium]|nr:MAG: RedB [bacterium]
MALTLWGFLVVAGLAFASSYGAAAGTPAHAPVVAQKDAKSRLLVFLHPECPCSRATVANLDRLIASVGPDLEITAYVFQPRKIPAHWGHLELANAVRRIPGVNLVGDTDGRWASRYGASTSGQVLLYSAGGKLVFSGGITPSRGHEGDSSGADAIVKYVQDGRSDLASAPVYGCAISGGQGE